jgi:hypothetical protein
MPTKTNGLTSNFISLLLLLGAALWSVMQMFSWLVSSIFGYLLATYEACQSIALQKPNQDREVMYNLINYPDEISSDL